MKAETKEIIESIKHVLEYNSNDDQSFLIQAIDFLDSLPGLEEQLKHGGFIPDRNKKPCKYGDKIKLFFKDTGDAIGEGSLIWDSKKYCFYAISEYENGNIKRDITDGGEYEFERIDSGAEKK